MGGIGLLRLTGGATGEAGSGADAAPSGSSPPPPADAYDEEGEGVIDSVITAFMVLGAGAFFVLAWAVYRQQHTLCAMTPKVEKRVEMPSAIDNNKNPPTVSFGESTAL